jgi:hypothetical protein
MVVSKNISAKLPSLNYIRRGGAYSTHTKIWSYTSLPYSCTLLALVLVVFGASKATWKDCLLGRNATLV